MIKSINQTGIANVVALCDVALDSRHTASSEAIFPLESTINFRFPARGDMPAMDIDWYDGKNNRPPVPDEFADR